MNQICKVVVITGASAGVGRATAREFARHGARIGLLARGIDGLKAARREVEELGSEALVIPTDLADADQVESAAAQIEAEFRSHRYLDQQRHDIGVFANQGNDRRGISGAIAGA